MGEKNNGRTLRTGSEYSLTKPFNSKTKLRSGSHFMAQLDNPQVAFSMRQKRPRFLCTDCHPSPPPLFTFTGCQQVIYTITLLNNITEVKKGMQQYPQPIVDAVFRYAV